MKIHTAQYKELEELLKSIGLEYKIENKKVREGHYEDFNWFGLPEFNWNEDILKNKSYIIKLPEEKRELLFKTLGKTPTKRNYIHYKININPYKQYEYNIREPVNPEYPVYIISKGRWEKRLTSDSLEKMNCPYKIVVEPSEYDNYVKYIDKSKILKLPEDLSKQGKGGVPVRNFVWEHSRSLGYEKHWILDDNIDGFYRWNYNVKKRVNSGIVFKVLEEYCDRFTNIGISCLNYKMDVYDIHIQKPLLQINQKCYSCLLINHKLLDKYGLKWEGRYNEDVDLVIRTIKQGLCTISLNNFLCDKKSTGMKGGNEDIYKNFTHKGFQDKFDELHNKHPEYVKLVRKHKDGRPHHKVNYNKIKPNNKPVLKDSYKDFTDNTDEKNMIFSKKN